MTLSARVLQGNKIKEGITELAHAVVESGRSEICSAGQQAANSGRISRLDSRGRIPSPGNLSFCSRGCQMFE